MWYEKAFKTNKTCAPLARALCAGASYQASSQIRKPIFIPWSSEHTALLPTGEVTPFIKDLVSWAAHVYRNLPMRWPLYARETLARLKRAVLDTERAGSGLEPRGWPTTTKKTFSMGWLTQPHFDPQGIMAGLLDKRGPKQ
jgi:hypothetical protein